MLKKVWIFNQHSLSPTDMSFNYLFVTITVTILDILGILINHQSLIKPTCMSSEHQLPMRQTFWGLQQIAASLQWDLKWRKFVLILATTEGKGEAGCKERAGQKGLTAVRHYWIMVSVTNIKQMASCAVGIVLGIGHCQDRVFDSNKGAHTAGIAVCRYH